MKIRLEMQHLSIPFRFAYGHSKASHRGVELVVCTARDENGICGYGEAVPRHYVTGESCASVLKDAKRIAPALLSAAQNIETLRAALHGQAEQWEGPFPSCAFCAVELALLDLLSRRANAPFHLVFGERKRDELSYSGSIGMGSPLFLKAQLLAYRAMGLKSFKLKVGGEHDEERLKTVRRILGDEVRIFVDANGTWNKETAIRKIETFHALGVWGIEEPLQRRTPVPSSLQQDCEETLDAQHYQNNAWLRQRSPIPLIADESVISPRSLRAAVEHEAFDVVDIRLSKLGGGLLSANMVEQATAAGLRFYIGAMVGESAILASAGSSFGSVHAEHLLIQGHSHRALHGKKTIKGGPRLRHGGKLRLNNAAGLGIFPNPKALDALTIEKETIGT